MARKVGHLSMKFENRILFLKGKSLFVCSSFGLLLKYVFAVFVGVIGFFSSLKGNPLDPNSMVDYLATVASR